MHRSLSLTLLAIAFAAAEESPTIIVAAERGESDLARTPVSVERVTADDMRERGGALNATDWLRDLAGVGVYGTGGGIDGGTIQVRLRGLDEKYTLMLVDGVPLSDQSSLDGRIRLPLYQPAGLSAMEVVKGSQSGLYGSSAVGGIVDMRTARPTASHKLSASATYGSFESLQGEAVATGPLGGGAGYALAVNGLASEGFSAQTASPDGDDDGHEPDGTNRYAMRARIEQKLGEAGTLYVAGQRSRNRQDYDGGAPDDADSHNLYEQWQVSGGGRLASGDAVSADLDLSYQDNTTTSHYGLSEPGTYQSGMWYGSLRSSVRVAGHGKVGLGLDARRESVESIGSPGAQPSVDTAVDQLGAYLQAQWSDERLELSAVGRIDRHEEFGTEPTGRLAAAFFAVPKQVKLRGALSTGFNAPTLYEMYHHEPGNPAWWWPESNGNPDLDPETSLSYEGGIDWTPMIGVDVGVTAFRSEVEDQIIYLNGTFPAASTYANDDGTSVSRGLEAKAAIDQCLDPVWTLRVEGTYTYLDAEDATGDAAPFAPQHAGGARLTVGQYVGDWRLWQGMGARRSTPYYANIDEQDRIEGVTIADAVLGVSYQERWDVSLRVDNLFDEVYVPNRSELYGQTYAGAPRSYWLTVSGRF
ncbi:MAG: TonB-dependent receptor [Planctomycetes bacterium]|nr:TonB-dependent receptor [Planctomycetota bacterium]